MQTLVCQSACQNGVALCCQVRVDNIKKTVAVGNAAKFAETVDVTYRQFLRQLAYCPAQRKRVCVRWRTVDRGASFSGISLSTELSQ